MTEKKDNSDIEILKTEGVRKAFVLNQPFVPAFSALLLLKQGRLTVRYRQEEHVISAYDMLLLNRLVVVELLEVSPDAEMLMVAMGNDFQHRVPVRFNKLDMIQYFATSPALQLSFSENEFNDIWEIVRIMEARQHHTGFTFTIDLLHTLLVSVSYMMAKQISENLPLKNRSDSRREKLTVEFIRLLHVHFRQQHNLNFYAQRLRVTSKHLSESLKKVTGFTGRELINMALVCEAKVLLVNDNLKVAAVSEQLNFSDQFAFSKFFKRLTNTNPTEYSRGLLSCNP
ncbi:helix-turn-helix transcriptional regulator [Maribellus sp. CM-23]|uniref:helix-turn-helix domain-containing protein n=1 Tax=Maribellus sp. CM-23 TaxID=2781026 RepID=UPI001F382DF8|nr:AraC family transcriptional regulator [Maribellus sp. CM-23]MCE4565795.1 helix-turn-helix transcriptional regulator [Maribellus sp. CM-23]